MTTHAKTIEFTLLHLINANTISQESSFVAADENVYLTETLTPIFLPSLSTSAKSE